MPNGGSDCCGTCWFNRANGGEAGFGKFDRNIQSFCEIRHLDIPSPFYTYCANHPHHRPERDPIPIGPVYIGDSEGRREFWKKSPDTEEIRQHLLDVIRDPGEHADGYPFYAPSPHLRAIEQLVNFGDERVIEALEDLAQRKEVEKVRSDILELIETVRAKIAESRR